MVLGTDPMTSFAESTPAVAVSEEAPFTLPSEITCWLREDNCGLCSVDFSSKLQAKMHYETGSHRRKLRSAVANYCLVRELPLPAEYQKDATNGKRVVKAETSDGRRCKICKQAFLSDLQAQQHYLGKNHLRRIDGKPPLKRGYVNLFTGKWQKQLPTKEELNVTGWWTNSRSGLSSQNAIDVDDDPPAKVPRKTMKLSIPSSDDIVEISSSLVSSVRRLSTPR